MGRAAAMALVALAAAGPARGACDPAPTHRADGFVLIGRGPVQAGSPFGRRAVLTVNRDRRDGRFAGKLFWLIGRRGPPEVRLSGKALDGPGRLQVRAATGIGDGATLILRRALVARARPQRRDRWVGAPGEIRVPAPGCYRLRASWPGGGWQVIIRARTPAPSRG
jgi:hypothetical protein